MEKWNQCTRPSAQPKPLIVPLMDAVPPQLTRLAINQPLAAQLKDISRTLTTVLSSTIALWPQLLRRRSSPTLVLLITTLTATPGTARDAF